MLNITGSIFQFMYNMPFILAENIYGITKIIFMMN